MTTRSKVGIFKPKLFTVESTTKQLESEPNSVTKALQSNKWKKSYGTKNSGIKSKSNMLPNILSSTL